MKTHDDYQLELEMRRHGALDPEATVALEEHLRGCELCRRAEAVAQSTEAAMHDTAAAAVLGMDWERIRRSIRREQKVLKLLPALMLASFVGQGAIFAWLLDPDRFGRAMAIFSGLGVLFALGTWLAMRGRVRKAEAATRLDSAGLLQHRRRELDEKIREQRIGVWMLALGSVPMVAIPALKHSAAGALGAFAAVAACGLGAAAYYQWVSLPKLRRERHELG